MEFVVGFNIFLFILYTYLIYKKIKRGYVPPDEKELLRRKRKNERLKALRLRLIQEGKLKDYTKDV